MGSIVLIIIFVSVLATEGGKFVLDGTHIYSCGHIHINGFNLRCVELQQAQFGIHTVVRGEFRHVKFKVGHDCGFSVELDVLRLEVTQRMCADKPFQRVLLVGRAFLAPSCFHTFHVLFFLSCCGVGVDGASTAL